MQVFVLPSTHAIFLTTTLIFRRRNNLDRQCERVKQVKRSELMRDGALLRLHSCFATCGNTGVSRNTRIRLVNADMSSSTGSTFGGFKHFGKASITFTWAVAMYQLASVLVAPFIFAIGSQWPCCQWAQDEAQQTPFGWVLIVFCIAFGVLLLLIMGLKGRRPFLILPHLILWGLYVFIYVINSISSLFSKTGHYTLMSVFIIIFFVALVLIECRCFQEIYKKSKVVCVSKEETTIVKSSAAPTAYASPC